MSDTLPSQPREPEFWVKILRGSTPVANIKMPIKRYLSIGRAEFLNNIVLFDPEVSRIHAVIKRQNGTYFIEDMQTDLGTKVNGQFIDGPVDLKTDDHIQIAFTSFIVSIYENVSYSYKDDATTGSTSLE